jgi:hypothetical protein
MKPFSELTPHTTQYVLQYALNASRFEGIWRVKETWYSPPPENFFRISKPSLNYKQE